MNHTESAQIEFGTPDPTAAAHAQAAPVLTPAERLALSRAAIRASLINRRGGAESPRAPGQRAAWFGGLRGVFSHVPMSDVAMRWAGRWWARHPWRATVEFALDAGDEIVRPVAQKHPWMLMAGALGVGMLMTRARPWRWISSGALLAGLLPRVHMASFFDWLTSKLRHGAHDEAEPSPTSSNTDSAHETPWPWDDEAAARDAARDIVRQAADAASVSEEPFRPAPSAAEPMASQDPHDRARMLYPSQT